MNPPSILRRLAFVLGSVLIVVAVPAVKAETVAPRAEKKALPVATAFEKDVGDNGPMVLKITNTSSSAIAVRVVVIESVLSHAKPRNRKHDHLIEAGKSAAVTGLAAADKVTITAEGYESVELVVK